MEACLADHARSRSGTSTSGLDWEEALSRLARLDPQAAGADLDEKLARRTRALAEPEAIDAGVVQLELITFGWGGLRYAIPVEQAQAVVQPRNLLSLPGVGEPHLGVMAHGGQLYTVVDPAALSDHAMQARPSPTFAVLIRHPVQALGIAADEILGVRRVAADIFDTVSSHYSMVVAILPGGEHVLSPDNIGRNVGLVVDHRRHDGRST